MHAFAALLDTLSTRASRTGKLALMAAYFKTTPDPDRGWALAALTDGVPLKIPFRRVLASLMETRADPVLAKLSRDYVGDTAETVALLWPEREEPRASLPSLDQIMHALQLAPTGGIEPIIAAHLDAADITERWAYLKFIGGALRVGVSARLAKTALAQAFARDVGEIEEVWHALKPPYTALFAWLEGSGLRPETKGVPVFRPLMLASPIEATDWPGLTPADFAAEWKWDGIRIQISAVAGIVRLFSRTGEDISAAFPELAQAFAGLDATADGELLILRDGIVQPFNDLQQRLNRKSVTAKQLASHPAHVRLYDLLTRGDDDLRALPFDQRRAQLEAWHASHAPKLSDLSALIAFDTFAALDTLHTEARAAGIEGLMLKRRASPYLAGRPRGHWFKWKRAALTLDCVLMYAQRGAGKRSSLYSDYTFGVWRDDGGGARTLVPVGKAYSGFTDAELKQLDTFIRANTTETFGPVRAVKPELVLEVAFDAVQASSRHKSGVAMRFPRIHRIRWDKPAAEAETLETVKALIVSPVWSVFGVE
jgi:DNA ligase 1